LLGGRFVLLKHTGRRSSRERQTVLEVVFHDLASARVIVCSGWGERSDWYRNVMANPNITFESNGISHCGVAHQLSVIDAASVLELYGRRHPRAFAALAKRMLADPPTGDPEPLAMRLAADLPVVALVANDPRSP
jgi:deazaflavin-dependent oxidoreductase (nitroreductase family)